MEYPAIQEILQNYVAGAQVVVEQSLAQQYEAPVEAALFALRDACIKTQLVLKTKQDPAQLERFASYVLKAIAACAAIDTSAPVKLTLAN